MRYLLTKRDIEFIDSYVKENYRIGKGHITHFMKFLNEYKQTKVKKHGRL